MGLARGLKTTLQKRSARAASDQVRGAGIFEKALNRAGLEYHRRFAFFDFSKHAEIQTRFDLDHISAGEDSSQTPTGNVLTHDKLCKWWTVEGLPGSGKASFAEEFAAATGVKNFGTSHLLWELERLREVHGREAFYQMWKELYDDGMHYLKMRNVDINDFFANPNDPVHSCRMQDHMKLQRHIHSMDALRHLLSTAEGVITNRTHHSDYCYAYAMMKMGYMSKNFYEMRYCVSQATADGSGTATDLTPNISFYLDISPEESFESIKARGNEAEIATCNLDFLRYVEEGYKTLWAQDMDHKGCNVLTQPKGGDVADVADWIQVSEEDDLRHVNSRWAYASERQQGFNNRSREWGGDQAFLETFACRPDYNRFRRSETTLGAWLRPGGMAGNFYEKVLQCDLTQGPHYSYKILHTFHPWDDLAESNSYIENFMLLNDVSQFTETGFSTHGITEIPSILELRTHPDWKDDGTFVQKMKIAFGSSEKYYGDEHVQKSTTQYQL